MTDFYLLSKADCALCEQAWQMLQQLSLPHPVQVHRVDIALQPELLQEYAWLVPVLIRAHDDAELRWPFDDALLEFLQS